MMQGILWAFVDNRNQLSSTERNGVFYVFVCVKNIIMKNKENGH